MLRGRWARAVDRYFRRFLTGNYPAEFLLSILLFQNTPMNENQSVQMFDQNKALQVAAANDAAAVARATQEIQAALVVAQRNPRNEVVAFERVINACKRMDLAESAEYEYRRGGTKITGPTIDLLRACATRWGNIRFGWSVTERKEDSSTVRAFAWDLQTNVQAERTFTVRHWRDTQQGGYALTDERDIYELQANMAARRVRACLEEVVDPDLVNKAVDQCRETLRTGEKTPLKDRVIGMVAAFREMGVTPEMIESHLGNNLDAVSDNQFASLKRIYKSMRDGVGKREDYFKPQTAAPNMPGMDSGEAPRSAATANKPPLDAGMGQNPTEGLKTAPEPSQAQSGASPEPTQPATGAERAFNALKSLRLLLSAGGIKEGQLLDYWAGQHITDGTASSLEEVALGNPALIANAGGDGWTELHKALKEMKASKKRGGE